MGIHIYTTVLQHDQKTSHAPSETSCRGVYVLAHLTLQGKWYEAEALHHVRGFFSIQKQKDVLGRFGRRSEAKDTGADPPLKTTTLIVHK